MVILILAYLAVYARLPACAAKINSGIDFISAGALLNVLSLVKRTGRQIVFHHPNHLVAELFGVVGLTAVAAIVFEKH